MKRKSSRDEHGAGLPLVALSLTFVLMMVLLLAAISDKTLDRARAQAAADAAALAGAGEGAIVAGQFASRNGARMVSFSASGNEVVVIVEYDGTRAIARAKRSLVLDPDG